MTAPAIPRASPTADLVVLSHLRWDWVWQRPQHLISRISKGRRTVFVEEPIATDVPAPVLKRRREGPMMRLWFEVPDEKPAQPYGAETSPLYVEALRALLGERPRDVWLYTPAAMGIAEALLPRLLVYDMMDDLASFAQAPRDMRHMMSRALTRADVAFTGGRSLHRAALAVREGRPTHLFPSGVESAHYGRSRTLRRSRQRPVAGYVGVVDERLDLELLAGLSAQLPDWDIVLVGPTAKIDSAAVPSAPNITRLGQQSYARLPEIMASFDAALMPFALNEATRAISPTKTLEYLASGLPVISTRVPDVVSDWGAVVHLSDDAGGFAATARKVLGESPAERDRALAPIVSRYEWDAIAANMSAVLERALHCSGPAPTR